MIFLFLNSKPEVKFKYALKKCFKFNINNIPIPVTCSKKLKIIKNVLNYCKIRKANEKSILNINENNLKATIVNLGVCGPPYPSVVLEIR